MKFTAQLTGLDRLSTALSGIAGVDGLAATLQACAEDVRDAASASLTDGAPPDSRTGALARSLRIVPGDDGLSVTVSTTLNYGWHLEYGSLARSASPWLTPALDTAAPSIRLRLSDWLRATAR